jgi:K+:H+ antiporter
LHGTDLILTATGGLAAALVLGYITERLRLSPIVGYLLAGVVVGPYTPGFSADRALAEQLAEIGVILLMFGVGMQFHFKELLAVRRVAVPGAVVQSLVATVLGALAARVVGWEWTAGIVFGLALSVASTVVLVRVLSDHHDLHTPVGHIAVGWLVVEDLFTVLILVLMPAVFAGGDLESASSAELATNLGLALVKIAAFVALTMTLGGRIIPALLERAAVSRSRELFNLTVLVIALGIAVVAARWFGVSMALGAFLAGLVVGRSEFSVRAAGEALPLRDAFGVLFFVSVGMLVNPRSILEEPTLVALALGVILIGKPAAAMLIVLLLRYPMSVALAVAVALAQIGEFSFMLATVARDLKVMDPSGTNALVAAAIVSISLNPLLYRAVDPVAARIRRPSEGSTPPVERGTRDSEPPAEDTFRAIVVGYGPSGQSVTRLLLENGIRPTVIDLNFDVIRRLQEEGIHAVYGDALRRETLLEAGIQNARYLILASAALQGAEEIIRVARELNPGIRILARGTYLRDLAPLRRAGADRCSRGKGKSRSRLLKRSCANSVRHPIRSIVSAPACTKNLFLESNRHARRTRSVDRRVGIRHRLQVVEEFANAGLPA